MAFGTRIKTLGGTKSSISLDELIDGSANIKTVRDNKSIQSVIDSITDATADNPYVVNVPPGHENESFTGINHVRVTSIGGPQNVITVHNGQTIQSVIDSITDASADNQYIIKIPPGVYCLKISLKEYVHLRGSNKFGCILRSTGIWDQLIFPATTETIVLENLTIETTYVKELMSGAGGTLGDHRKILFRNCRLFSETLTGKSLTASNWHCDITFENCYTESNSDTFWMNANSSRVMNFTFINHHHHAKTYTERGSGIFVSLKTDTCFVKCMNCLIEGVSDHTYGPTAFKTTAGELRVYSTRVDLENSATATLSRGVFINPISASIDIEVHGGSLDTHGGYDVYNDTALTTGLNIYNTKYTKSLGVVNGYHRIENETATGTFTLNPSGVTIIDSSGGAITGTLPDGHYIGQRKTIVMTDATTSSTVSATHHVTSDPEVATFNAVDETWILDWTGTEWVTIYATCTFI